jgi:LuxR family maltose regulon positive regulatory protein
MSWLIEHFVDLPSDLYLVLDDYHFIASRKIHDAVFHFLNHMPANVHVVITSRHKIPFSLSGFKVRNQIVEISASDMRFTEEETERFFAEIIPVKLSIDEAHEVARHTEGWVGGLQLFGLSLRGKKIPDNLRSALARVDQDAKEYLVNEVVNVQSGKVRGFLETTALLDRFNADVCKEITGIIDSGGMLDNIYRNNLFLISLDTGGKWYRYHHLLSEAVRERMRVASPETPRRIHKKAALWFARNGYLEDAFRNAFASEDNEFAADLLEDHFFTLHEQCEVVSGLRWLARLPDEIFRERALLRLHECSLRIESLQIGYVEAILEDIENRETQVLERYRGFKKKLCQDLLAYLRYVLPQLRESAKNDSNQLSGDFQRIFSHSGLVSGIIEDIIVGQHLIQEDMLVASNALKQASSKIFQSESTWARLIWFKSMAYVERWQGNLSGSESVLNEAFSFLARRGLADSPLKLMLYPAMAWVHYFRNDLQKALAHATIAVGHAEQACSVKDIMEGNIVLAFIYVAVGDYAAANTCINRTKWASRTTGNALLIAFADAVTAGLSLVIGDVVWVKEWAHQRRLSVDEPFSFRYVHECLAQAQLLFQGKAYEEATHMLEMLRNRCMEQNMLEPVFGIDLFLAADLYTLNDRARAKTVMDRAIGFAEAEGYVRSFVHYIPAISAVLVRMERIQSHESGPTYLSIMMKASGIYRNSRVAPDGTTRKRICGLTPREMDILEFMAAGYKDKEIAEKIFISFHTVRTHTKRIFQKLDVRTRVQAIQRAAELRVSSDSS